MDRRKQPTCLNMKHKAVCNGRLNECEPASTKIVSASLKLERHPVKESERRRRTARGGGWVSKLREAKWMGEGEQRGKRMEGGERKGWWGHCGELTACEYGLTSWVRLQVSSAGLEKTKIKPRNVNLFSIVNSKKRQIKSEYIHIK